jgi:4-hydroxybenzoate polyprenyltransferase
MSSEPTNDGPLVPSAEAALTPSPNRARAVVKALRPHQWAKNALVLLPTLLAPGVPRLETAFAAVVAAAAFSLGASSGYVLNDLLDIEADRKHPTKRKRPFASGALPVAFGPPLLLALVVAAFGLSLTLLPWRFSLMLAIYMVATISYSLVLKKKLMLDVLVLAGLYAHRILSGGIATGIHVSVWLLGFSMFFFTSLAFAKRYVELAQLTGEDRVANRGYYRNDLMMVTSMGTSTAYISALVFLLYLESGAVRSGYREPLLLWLALPVLLYWLGRLWFLAGRGQMQDDPVRYAIRDPLSLACGGLIGLIAILARFAPSWLTGVLH